MFHWCSLASVLLIVFHLLFQCASLSRPPSRRSPSGSRHEVSEPVVPPDTAISSSLPQPLWRGQRRVFVRTDPRGCRDMAPKKLSLSSLSSAPEVGGFLWRSSTAYGRLCSRRGHLIPAFGHAQARNVLRPSQTMRASGEGVSMPVSRRTQSPHSSQSAGPLVATLTRMGCSTPSLRAAGLGIDGAFKPPRTVWP